MKALVTGAAGFIGLHLCKHLLNLDFKVIALDNFDDFYSIELKKNRIKNLQNQFIEKFTFVELDILEINQLDFEELDGEESIDVVFHLAAKVGVLHSLNHDQEYQRVNVDGTLEVLKLAQSLGEKFSKFPKIILASSSSVYGGGATPFKESQKLDPSLNPYSNSKFEMEKATQRFLKNFLTSQDGLQIVCPRLFSVYGPEQRPDLVLHKFFNQIQSGETIQIYGDGSASRDYTFIGDVIEGIYSCFDFLLHQKSEENFFVFNIGSGVPISISQCLSVLKEKTKVVQSISVNYASSKSAEMQITYADTHKAQRELGWRAKTEFSVGVEKFLEWKMNQKES